MIVMGKPMAVPELKLVEIDYAHEGAENCKALGQIFDRIGDKWTIMVVGVLSHGPLRFNALQRAIPGISHRMLTITLRGLERDGMVKRTSFATIPPRVDYELTERGQSLQQPLQTLASWVRSQQPGIKESQRIYDEKSGGED
jgi:DNA-binding HxlR family transcriptional regulator